MRLDPVLAARYRALASTALARPGSPFSTVPSRLAVVDVARQRMGLLVDGALAFEAPVSTALNGIGGEEGSHRTPPGWHRVHARIGLGAESGTVFRSREATGEMWRGEAREEDLILTRVLTLDGLEPGVNQGPGRDSRERYIYLHGTNQEARLGQAVSHGCVRLANAAVIGLADLLREGDPVLVAVEGAEAGLGLGRLHFAGVGGSGMSALAQFCALEGSPVSGSDRSFDRGERPEARALLAACGIRFMPQDGTAVAGDCAAVICSTAVEDTVPDVIAARAAGVPVLHRSELLAHLVASHRTVAVTGTSGKSTTTAMVFELLRGAGRDPSVITGGDLRLLQAEGTWGNAHVGASGLLVIEADESDGSLVRYAPAVGVVLNLQRDHKELDVVEGFYRTFLAQCREGAVIGEAENLAAYRDGRTVTGFGAAATLRAEAVSLAPGCSRFTVEGTAFELPLPGRHNVEDALAALAACRLLGVPLADLVAPLAGFQGVGRRFQLMGEARGVKVVDDYAHNPAKVEAALKAAQSQGGRVLAIFQPHGFGPLAFMREDLVQVLKATLRPEDRLWFLPVFYPGGTVHRTVESDDVVADLRALGVPAHLAPRADLPARVAAEAQAGDLVLLMGARDPSLPELAEELLASLG
ncbi:MAG TPA: L,D-transpeptidase family protein [Holophagaceae bacterium]|nr:L,D-transpeptidase family protein [Holophagaceae bacterium]HJW32855.1 L,D-transpeptidase family protein [Holophagaceae bacterium]